MIKAEVRESILFISTYSIIHKSQADKIYVHFVG